MTADIHELWTWQAADTAATLKRFELDRLFEKLGIGANAEDLFGEVPATYVHEGDIAHGEPLLLDARGHGIFIIDGSLTIDGAFTYYTADAYTILVITGDLRAVHYHQAWDTQLVVLGETVIGGLFYFDVSDAGFAFFEDVVTARERLVVSGDPMFAKIPRGEVRAFHELHDDSKDPSELHDKLVRGVDLFPPPPAGAKPPSDAELRKMTVEQVLTSTSGFEEMQIEDGTINPNYFRLGKPGAPLEKLVLISETYLDAFPSTLATLESLKLLNNSDGARLATMLRSLPTLRGLKKLRISGTAIDRIPSEIGALENLVELDICNNESLTALPPELGKLTRLRRLTVTGNAIEKLPEGLDLDRMTYLNFDEKALKLRRRPER